METLKLAELTELPSVVDIMTAARALGLSRTHAYDLAKRGEFPCKVLRIGTSYRVPTANLLTLLGMATPAVPARKD
ncbi:helix-turn-helix domain-containing protein [Thermomonospora cellulosilytica]|uniref:Putative DNA-binding transcriptional regulator AlpA n=1 Tax=Thermomonospora cellulosilytica TaxID=1411118 RepID=A0A7W3N4B8_9ACTN|nr:helix-turn-helix domain-containing protein [Thermomonospora cellulosilytica]MBA9007309.1 putative DNA-binding transcriptional regulator AlpA [Thermomonospora cellulosilytica]